LLNANNISKDDQAFSCVRFGNVASSRGSVIPVYIDNLLNQTPLQVTDPEVTRFVIEIADAVRLITKATEYARGGEIFILRMKAFRLGDLVDVMLNGIAPRLNIVKENIEVNATGLLPGEKLHEDLMNDTESTRLYELDDMYVVLSYSESHPKYPAMRKVSLARYASSDVELITRDEIEDIVVKYLKNRSLELYQ